MNSFFRNASRLSLMTAVLSLSICELSQGAPGPSVTLEQAFQSALQKSESVPLAESQLREVSARYDQSQAKFLPKIDFKAQHQIQDTDIGTIGEKNQTTSRLALTQSLFAGGRDKANLNAADSERKSQEYNLENAKNTLYAAVARSFYSLLSAEKEVANTPNSASRLR